MPFDVESQNFYQEKNYHLPGILTSSTVGSTEPPTTPTTLTLASTQSSTLPPSISRRPPGKSHDGNPEPKTNNELVRDLIIGAADGLTVPFALTAGLSTLGSSRLVVLGGLAELFSGAISMGLGGYLACLTERDAYDAARAKEAQEVSQFPIDETKEIYEAMEKWGIEDNVTNYIMDHFHANHEHWVDFMMTVELKQEKPKKKRAYISLGALAGSYLIGGIIPMIPYFIIHNVDHALFVSIAITLVCLFAFGALKNYYTVGTVRSALWGAAQTMAIGVVAAGSSYGIVYGINLKEKVDTHVQSQTAIAKS